MPPKYRRPLFIGGVLLTAFLARAWGLADVGMWHDEAISHYYATMDPSWIICHAAGFINHPPLFFLLLKAWLNTVSYFNQFLVELMNVLIGTATVGVVLLWGRTLFSNWLAFLVGLLLAINPYHIHYSGELRMYALAALGVTVAGYFACRIIRGHSGVFYYGSWVIACLVSVYSHSFSALPITFMIIYFWYHRVTHGDLKRFLISTGLFLVCYAPWLWFVVGQASDISSGYWLPDFQWTFLLNLLWLLGGFVGPRSWDFYGISMAVGVTIGFVIPWLFSLRESHEPWVKLLWLMFGGPLALIVSMSLFGQSVFIYRTFVVLLPCVVLLVGKGLSVMSRQAIVPLTVLYAGLLGVGIVQLKAHPPHQYARNVAEWSKTHATDRTVIVHTDRFSFFPSYFYHKRAYDEYLLAANSNRSYAIGLNRVRRLNRSRPVLFILDSNDRDRIPPGWYDRARVNQKRRWSGRTYLLVKLPKSSLPDS